MKKSKKQNMWKKLVRITETFPEKIIPEEHVPELKHKAKVKRALNKEGLQESEKNIRYGLRERKPSNQLVTKQGERIIYS